MSTATLSPTNPAPALSKGWKWMTLGEVGRWFGGGTPLKGEAKYWENGTIPWVSPKDMKTDEITTAQDLITPLAIKESATNLVPPASMLMVVRSGILQHTLPLAVTKVNVALNQDLKAIQPLPFLEVKFLFYYLKSCENLILANCTKAGTTVQSIELPIFLRYPIPVPPLPIQRAIAARLDAQLSLLDASASKLKTLQAKLKRYRQALLKAAVTGELTRRWRESHGTAAEAAPALLERILRERRKAFCGRGKYAEPQAPDTSGLPALPEGWCWASSSAVCDVIVDCHNKTAPYSDSGIKLLRTTNIKNGKLLLDDVKYVTNETYEFWSRRCKPKSGDILFTREAPMGECGIIPPDEEICMGQRMMLLRPSVTVSNKYLLATLMSPILQYYFQIIAIGTGVQHLRVGDAENLPIPLPPLAEQQRIVAELEHRFTLLDRLESQINHNLKRTDALKQAALKKAFGIQVREK